VAVPVPHEARGPAYMPGSTLQACVDQGARSHTRVERTPALLAHNLAHRVHSAPIGGQQPRAILHCSSDGARGGELAGGSGGERLQHCDHRRWHPSRTHTLHSCLEQVQRVQSDAGAEASNRAS
jgi:catalase (peroxidase I)